MLRTESELLKQQGSQLISTGSWLTHQAHMLDKFTNNREKLDAQHRASIFRRVETQTNQKPALDVSTNQKPALNVSTNQETSSTLAEPYKTEQIGRAHV